MTYEVELGGTKVTVSIRPHPDGGYRISVDGRPERHVQAGRLGAAEWWLADSERGRRTVAVHLEGEKLSAQVEGHGVLGTVVDPRDKALSQMDSVGGGTIRTPMPGAVARVLVKVGDQVKQGQVLVVIEAMKMENEFRSPIDGVVKEVPVQVGAAIDGGTVLAVVEEGA